MRALLVSILGFLMIPLVIINEGAWIGSFFHMPVLALIFGVLTALTIFLLFRIKNKHKQSDLLDTEPIVGQGNRLIIAQRKILTILMGSVWLVGFVFVVIGLFGVLSNLGNANATQLGHGIAIVCTLGFWITLFNLIVLFPQFGYRLPHSHGELGETGISLLNGLAPYAIVFAVLFLVFFFLYLLSGGSTSNDPASAQEAVAEVLEILNASFSQVPYFMIITLTGSLAAFLLILGLPRKILDFRLWILGIGWVLGISALYFTMGIIMLFDNLGNMTGPMLIKGLAMLNQSLVVALFLAILCMLGAIIVWLVSRVRKDV